MWWGTANRIDVLIADDQVQIGAIVAEGIVARQIEVRQREVGLERAGRQIESGARHAGLLRLRPQGGQGEPAVSFSHALEYYEGWVCNPDAHREPVAAPLPFHDRRVEDPE